MRAGLLLAGDDKHTRTQLSNSCYEAVVLHEAGIVVTGMRASALPPSHSRGAADAFRRARVAEHAVRAVVCVYVVGIYIVQVRIRVRIRVRITVRFSEDVNG